jgi:superfamily II DNA helicase RecQ
MLLKSLAVMDALIYIDMEIVPNQQDAIVMSTLTVDSSHDYYMENYIRRAQYQYNTSVADVTNTLRHVLKNPSAEFRGNQLATILAIVRRDYSCVVQICATGMGKTLSFLLPAKLSPGGVTVVVSPLVNFAHNAL